ncbi:hypothetical protein CORC01_11706 [Colletotrichum orchidophilum]|uniref:Uncharacterized protein n=1 Tax=Colletotrichum orchidophilum TaxID=1209926 RepID=A0A1G4AV70_9PEZI|nr:uncharacterized protein CORC01_11706 [Colletotrichum orchidophilum]OHE92983.1 hypothetical protein CORC01_11706 [Colletotrichum orchidophilum]
MDSLLRLVCRFGPGFLQSYDREPAISAVEFEGWRGVIHDAVHRFICGDMCMSTTMGVEPFWKGTSALEESILPANVASRMEDSGPLRILLGWYSGHWETC